MPDETYLNPDELDHLAELSPSPSHRGLMLVVLALLALLVVGATQIPQVRGLWYRLVATPEPASLAWRETFEAAVAEAADSGRPLLIVFTGNSPSSFTMMNEVWPRQTIRTFADNSFVPLRIDLHDQALLASELGVSSAPTIVVFRHKQEIARLYGYRSPEALEQELRRIVE